MPNKNSIESEMRDILDCWCAYTGLYDGKMYNLRTKEYGDCSCVERLPELKNLIQREVKKGRVEELEALDVLEPCVPDCDEVRHARHEGSWNAYIKIRDRLEELEG